MKTYLPPPRRSRGRFWRCRLPRFDRQSRPDYYRPPAMKVSWWSRVRAWLDQEIVHP